MDSENERYGVIGRCRVVSLKDAMSDDIQHTKEMLKRGTKVKILEEVNENFFRVRTEWGNTGFVVRYFVLEDEAAKKELEKIAKKQGGDYNA